MYATKIIVDLSREERARPAIDDLVRAFEQAAGIKLTEDRTLLGQ